MGSSREPLELLGEVVAIAQTNLDILLDATRRPEVSPQGVSRMCLETLLRGIATTLSAVQNDPAAPQDLRERCAALARAAAAYERATIDVHHHLDQLAVGWKCGTCGATRAKSASASGVRANALRIELVCATCEKKTPLTNEGRQALKRIFGDLIGPAWNPLANSFEWDGR